MKRSARKHRIFTVLSLVVAIGWSGFLGGCSEEMLSPYGLSNIGHDNASSEFTTQGGHEQTVPAGLVTVQFGPESLRFWPYTGRDLSGTAVDPINLIFIGDANATQIRDALLSLDGNRSAFGYPSAFPFDATWREAVGDAQTTYFDGDGWVGSVIQLELGGYETVRFHLRLFQSEQSVAGGGVWTLGAAHFEVLIPGTPEHQVLSWERAEEIVLADFIRSGLLDQAIPIIPTQQINDSPWRNIPPAIYNELPPELIGFIGGPAPPAGAPVDIQNNGSAMILNVAERAAPQLGPRSQSFTVQFDQFVPKPFCSDGPADWVYITGPVEISQTAELDGEGVYSYNSRIAGHLSVTPVDITQSPPVPVGQPFDAIIGNNQRGSLRGILSTVNFQTRRIGPQDGGSELSMTHLRVAANGQSFYTSQSKCLE